MCLRSRDETIQNLKVSMNCPKISRYNDILQYLNSVNMLQNEPTFCFNPILMQCQLNNLTYMYFQNYEYVILFK